MYLSIHRQIQLLLNLVQHILNSVKAYNRNKSNIYSMTNHSAITIKKGQCRQNESDVDSCNTLK